MVNALTQPELETAHCWEPEDRVPGRPGITEFRRRVRYHQARWREGAGHPVGSQPIAPKPGGQLRLVGSRLPLDYARETGANFLNRNALAAARARTSVTEPHQSFDHQTAVGRPASSPAMAFNLFGDRASDLGLADRAVHTWWPDAPGTVCDVRFAHSPGRLDPAYLNSLRAFDVAFVLDLGYGTRGVVGVDTKYHEWLKPEIPKPSNLRRYLEVAQRSGVFAKGAVDAVGAVGAGQMWLEPPVDSRCPSTRAAPGWGAASCGPPCRKHRNIADGCARYRDLLVDQSTSRR